MHNRRFLSRLAGLLTGLVMLQPLAADPGSDVLRDVSANAANGQLQIQADIADGHYLYQSKISVRSKTPGLLLDSPQLPEAEILKDDFFGDLPVYRDQLTVTQGFSGGNNGEPLTVVLNFQACEDQGDCYPLRSREIEVAAVATATAAATPDPLDAIRDLGASFGFGAEEDELLPAEQAFQLDARVVDANTVQFSWEIADAYYLYQDKLKFTLDGPAGVAIGEPQLPKAKSKYDLAFEKDLHVYYGSLDVPVTITARPAEATDITITAAYQGCAERGVCYPPMKNTLTLSLPAAAAATTAASSNAAASASVDTSEQGKIFQLLAGDSMFSILGLMFLAGLGLAFTACVYPMIPILSSMIVGQGDSISTTRAFWLSMAYVQGVAVTYAAIGFATSLFGAGVQAWFQNPWILSGFAIVFVILALSMFGFFNLQMPNSIQSRLSEMSSKQKSGSFIGVFVMGVLSGLIVGPCAGPVLIGALTYIVQTGNVMLGGLALYAMGLGMGAPLLLVGTTGRELLPKAGGWMDNVKAAFGAILLGVAILMLERFLPGSITLALWGLLLIIPAIYMHALDSLPEAASGWLRFWKGLGVAMLIWGAMAIIGAATGGRDILRPLDHLSFGSGGSHESAAVVSGEHLDFQRIKTVEDLNNAIATATKNNQAVMLDFYADWCTYCITYETQVFNTAQVNKALEGVVVLQADVTDNDEADRALLDHLDLFVPPAILFWDTNGTELKHRRIVGFKDADAFTAHVNQTLNP